MHRHCEHIKNLIVWRKNPCTGTVKTVILIVLRKSPCTGKKEEERTDTREKTRENINDKRHERDDTFERR